MHARPQFSIKAVAKSRFFAVMNHRRDDRKLVLAEHVTRCIKRFEVHEIFIARYRHRKNPINNIDYLGFVEFENSTVLKIGDSVKLKGEKIGNIIGFNEDHAPNHMNIVLECPGKTKTGTEFNLGLGDPLEFESADENH